MAILLTCLTWARKVPAQAWLGLAAAAVIAGLALHIYTLGVEHERDAAATREWKQRTKRLQASIAEATIEKEDALDSARKLSDALSIKAAFLAQKVVTFHMTPPPVPTATPSGDSVTFSRSVWEGHVADDATRDSTLSDLAAIARDGIPAIRNQYEAVLAKDVKLFALKDSLIANAEARAKLATHPTSHWHAVLGPCYAVGAHHGVALCAAVGWSPF